MNHEAILGLLSELYANVAVANARANTLQQRVTELEERLKHVDKSTPNNSDV